MSPMLMFASLAITGALVLYTIGVFRERADGSLRGPHVVLFWIGLACDTTGTTLMSIMARTSAEAAPRDPRHHRARRDPAHALPCRLGDARLLSG